MLVNNISEANFITELYGDKKIFGIFDNPSIFIS